MHHARRRAGPRHMQRMDTLPRDAGGDLLAAFILCGWEKLMPLGEAIEASDFLSWHDADKARRLSGSLVRGEAPPAEIVDWLKSVRAEYPGAARV